MAAAEHEKITLYFEQMKAGDKDAMNRLLPHVYEHLRALAQNMFKDQNVGHTLQPTALVHEAYARLVGAVGQEYTDRKHFLRVAAIAMRQLLTDYARMRSSEKRGGRVQRVVLEEELHGAQTVGFDLLALDEVLTELRELNERQAEVVELRFLVGLTHQETADVLGVSERTVRLDWSMARAWLELRLADA